MERPSRDADDRERRLDRVIADQLAAADAGEATDLKELCERYPDLADELRGFFQGQARLDRWAGAVNSPSGLVFMGKGVERFGDFELVEEIGRGGMGVVYKAKQISLGRMVALKMILGGMVARSDVLERFQREARAMARIQHPSIVPVYEVGEVEGVHYYTMEFIDGPSLARVITLKCEESKKKPSSRSSASDSAHIMGAVEQMATLAEGLEEAHRQGLVHRDVKPSNILMDKTGRYVLLDFGLVRDVGDRTITRSGAMLGTLQYMSPEQVSGRKVGVPSDVYSLGATLYELLTLRPASDAQSEHGLQTAILSEEPIRPRKLNPKLNRDLEIILLHALEKNSERRYRTAGELAADLRRFLRQEPIVARPQSSITRLARGAWKHKVRISASLVLVILLFVLGILLKVQQELKKYSAIESLAILPFANAEADAGAGYLIDGLTENLINRLSKLPELRVLARSTAFQYKDRELNPLQIGNELGVRAVVTGEITQKNEDLSVKVELIDVTDGSRLWGDQYDGKLADLLAIQRRIARGISEALQLGLTADQQSGLTKPYTENTAAYRLYLKGRFFWNKRTPENLKKAIEHFEAAIDLDSNYALAYAGLADSYIVLGNYSVSPPRECHPKAEAAARKALTIDEDLSEAHTSLASVMFSYHFDWPAAERHFTRALALNPNSVMAHTWYADGLAVNGRFNEAMRQIELARKLDPLSHLVIALPAMHLYWAHKYDQALDRLREVLDLDPSYFPAHWFLGQVYLQKGMHGKAIGEFQQARDLSGGSPHMIALLGYAHAVAGQTDEARNILGELDNIAKTRYVPPLGIAIMYIGLDDKDRAFEHLEQAYQDRNWLLWSLKTDPIFANLQSDRRYAELLNKMGLD